MNEWKNSVQRWGGLFHDVSCIGGATGYAEYAEAYPHVK